jgi:DNA-binding protein HU-beta
MSKSMTKKDLVADLAKRTDVSQDKAANFLKELAAVAYEQAHADNGFTIPGLCKMEVVFRKARKGRNPRTGEPILIGARKSLKVSATGKAKDIVTPRPAGLVTALKITPIPAPAIAETEPEPSPPVQEAFRQIKCGLCGETIEASVSDQPFTASCPNCNGDILIPAATPGTPVVPPAPPPSDGDFVACRCPFCSQEIEAAKALAGTEINCPSCTEIITLPSENEITIPSAQSPQGDPGSPALFGTTMRIELPEDLTAASDPGPPTKKKRTVFRKHRQ